MNPNRLVTKFFALSSLVVLALGSSAPAGPSRPASPIATVAPAPAVVMVCSACKTAAVTEHRVLANPKVQVVSYTIGSIHACSHCGGEIATVNGKTTDSMLHNCPMCGASAALCCRRAPPAL
jgi:predicted RNA-binding Zn-ribbon protein involved in translation (DUF1610 family)